MTRQPHRRLAGVLAGTIVMLIWTCCSSSHLNGVTAWSFDDASYVCSVINRADQTYQPNFWTGFFALGGAQCQKREDALEALDTNLRLVFGQQNATNKIKAALYRHTFDRPLALHFAGDNGVGKTFAASLLAKSYFLENSYEASSSSSTSSGSSGSSSPKGLLTLEGEYFDSSLPAKIEEYRARIKRQVTRQLRQCEHSIILFDEVEKVDARTISVLEPFLEKPFVYPFADESETGNSNNNNNNVDLESAQVRTGGAIFIFTSDFGYDGLTRHKTAEELEAMVRRNVERYWHNRKKLGDLMQNVVPFVALDEAAILQVIEHRLADLVNVYGKREGLRHICYHKELPALLARDVIDGYGYMNARGVDILMNPRIVDPLLEQVSNKRRVLKHKGKLDVRISVVMEGEPPTDNKSEPQRWHVDVEVTSSEDASSSSSQQQQQEHTTKGKKKSSLFSRAQKLWHDLTSSRESTGRAEL